MVFATPHRATAIDAETGRLLWSTPLELPPVKAPFRLARYRDDWLAVYGVNVVVLDGDTGAIRARTRLGFTVRTILVQNGYVLLAGEGGTACFRDGEVRWTSRHDGTEAEIGRPSGLIARLPKFTHASIAIGMGSVVAQSDE